MFLKCLDIFGFKSFADRTHIEFSAGITALLGPNGCGKSNVVDAIKWVLGEQSSKNMRAEKMEDVIFNGTETRKSLNVAEVTLTISNEQNLLPLDKSEVAIKRRLYRSGETEYFINNTQVKLKDIRELFFDTGVGKTAYSVLEQGKIDQILSSKPEDRRYLFEEAAGITRFKVKRAEAERKLEKTNENMKQIDGILAEVKRAYDTLKIQSEKTLAYRAQKDEIFYLELDINLLRLRSFIQDREKRSEELGKLILNRDSLSAEIESASELLNENMDLVNELQNRISKMQNDQIGIAVQQNEKRNLNKVYADHLRETKTKIASLESKKNGIQEKIELLQEDTDEQEAALHDYNKRLTEIQKNIAGFEESIGISASRITNNDVQASLHEKEIALLDKARSELENELESVTEDIVKELDARLKDVGYSAQAHKKSHNELHDLIEKLVILVSGRKAIFADYAKIKTPNETEFAKFSESAFSSFTEIEQMVSRITEAIKNYTKNSPEFIDDFLSPEGIITKKRAVDRKIADNKSEIIQKRDIIAHLKSENSGLVEKIDEYRTTLEKLRINQAEMKTQSQSAEDQLKLLRRELAGQTAALVELENDIFAEKKRFGEIESNIEDIQSEIAELEMRGIKMTKEIESLEKDVYAKNSDVAGKQEKIKTKNAEIKKLQAQIETMNLDVARAETEIRNIKENFRDSHSRDLMEFEERMFGIQTAASTMKDKLNQVRQTIKELGNLNFNAPEEFAETKERYDFLSTQMADLQKARDDLHRITEEIRAESTELFLDTYNKIKKNFHNMFRRLFGGGRAELRLVDPQNILESGIDIYAQPPGKKLENIALLSGGERTMTAVSLLFATYMVRPSPFCLLDEIDAALDEHNVTRFISTLRTFANVSQYIVITHNKKTVAGAGTLLGITMEESGVTKVVSIRLENEGLVSIPQETETFEEEDVAPEEGVYIPPHPPKRHLEANSNA